jgi:hypothetical protein
MVIDLLEHGMYVGLIRGPEGLYPMIVGGENSEDFSQIMRSYGNIIVAEEFYVDPEIIRKIGSGPNPSLPALIKKINQGMMTDVQSELDKLCNPR